VGLLDGDLQQMFGAAFGGVVLEGRHYHKTTTRQPNGDVDSEVTKTQSVRGFRMSMNQAMRDAGYADTSARLIILCTYEGRVLDPLYRGDMVRLDGDWVVGNIDSDPAHTHWVLWVTRA
jgi:hypothetical protein